MPQKNLLKKFSLGLILGAIIATGFALLYAPAAGKEMIDKIQSGLKNNGFRRSKIGYRL